MVVSMFKKMGLGQMKSVSVVELSNSDEKPSASAKPIDAVVAASPNAVVVTVKAKKTLVKTTGLVDAAKVVAPVPVPVSEAKVAAKAVKVVKVVKVVKASTSSVSKSAVVAPSPSKTQAAVVAPPVVDVSKPQPIPRAARGSRLAQLTVPSMAQAVASTAAKASYTHTQSTPAYVAPPHAAPKKDPKLANNWKSKPVADLIDAEVLAMSDDYYMNDPQLAFFRLKLVHLKMEILNSAGETTEHLREDTVVVPDPADRATIEEEHALELRTRDRERKLLKKIEQSINRIDSGDYGYCDETGEAIGVGRLLARPTASLSLEAQQRRELKQKMFGD